MEKKSAPKFKAQYDFLDIQLQTLSDDEIDLTHFCEDYYAIKNVEPRIYGSHGPPEAKIYINELLKCRISAEKKKNS